MEGRVCWPYFDPEYENLSHRINPPRVSIDNISCSKCTLIKVDSVNKPGTLLEVVQVLSDLDLIITKAYISSDGGWFMDVFHVTDQQGNKLRDKKVIEYIEMALSPKRKVQGASSSNWSAKTVELQSIGDHTAIELIGTDRPGLISEIFAVLSSLRCNVLGAEVWTHKMRVACILYVNDGDTSSAVDDPARLTLMEEQLRNVLRGCGNDTKEAHTTFSVRSTHADRRLHQLMFADKDYENNVDFEEKGADIFKPVVTIDYCQDKGYSVVTVRCKDRSKLLFDIVCTLTDMQYSVFHAAVSSEGPYAMQEFYIRHGDGLILDSDSDKEKVIKCLEAAILRRVSEGLRLEVSARDRVGLLSDVTRVLREHGLSVARAGASTLGGQAMNVFYVKDSSGNPVDMKTIEALRREIGHTIRLNIRKVGNSNKTPEPNGSAKPGFSFGSLLERFLA